MSQKYEKYENLSITGEIFLSEKELNECKEKNYINNDYRVCGQNALKPNLRDSITVSVPFKNAKYYFYYFKLSENKITRIKVDDEFPVGENDDVKVNTKKLEIIAKVIPFYYYCITKYFQEKIASLDIQKLYNEYSEEGLKKVEKIMQEITLFYAKMYYEFPMLENRKKAEKTLELMEKLNVNEQLKELEKTISLIRDIVNYQLERKREREKEEEAKRSEKWNMIFTTIGVVLAIIQIVQGFLDKLR
nr:hypothetical protein [uncultured Leptotrichia sp.]